MSRKQVQIRVFEDTVPILQKAQRIASFRGDKTLKVQDVIHSIAEKFVEEASESEKAKTV